MGEGMSESEKQLAAAPTGVGPLLARDYWAVIEHAKLGPRQVMAEVKTHFTSLAPEELARFAATDSGQPLQPGAELCIRIAAAGDCQVRVVHCDACSITLATLEGHPEAGRITFGAYRSKEGKLVFHIRSHARSESLLRLFGFVVVGEAMQTNTWTAFISRVAALAGGRVQGFVHADMKAIDDAEDGAVDQPTFIARED